MRSCADGREDARYVDHNLNRLPRKSELGQATSVYEYQRAAELLPILEQVDGVLDLHSTSSDAPPMLICVDDASAQLVQDAVFPFTHVIGDIHQHISGNFLIEYATKARTRILAECGQHECLDASQRAIDISLAFLHSMEMVEDFQSSEIAIRPFYYQCKQAVFLPKDCGDFRLREFIKPFEFIEQGRVLACNGTDHELMSPQDGYAIMAPETQNILDCNEALFFLCERK